MTRVLNNLGQWIVVVIMAGMMAATIGLLMYVVLDALRTPVLITSVVSWVVTAVVLVWTVRMVAQRVHV